MSWELRNQKLTKKLADKFILHCYKLRIFIMLRIQIELQNIILAEWYIQSIRTDNRAEFFQGSLHDLTCELMLISRQSEVISFIEKSPLPWTRWQRIFSWQLTVVGSRIKMLLRFSFLIFLTISFLEALVETSWTTTCLGPCSQEY